MPVYLILVPFDGCERVINKIRENLKDYNLFTSPPSARDKIYCNPPLMNIVLKTNENIDELDLNSNDNIFDTFDGNDEYMWDKCVNYAMEGTWISVTAITNDQYIRYFESMSPTCGVNEAIKMFPELLDRPKKLKLLLNFMPKYRKEKEVWKNPILKWTFDDLRDSYV